MHSEQALGSREQGPRPPALDAEVPVEIAGAMGCEPPEPERRGDGDADHLAAEVEDEEEDASREGPPGAAERVDGRGSDECDGKGRQGHAKEKDVQRNRDRSAPPALQRGLISPARVVHSGFLKPQPASV
jgi:hypothetical protein